MKKTIFILILFSSLSFINKLQGVEGLKKRTYENRVYNISSTAIALGFFACAVDTIFDANKILRGGRLFIFFGLLGASGNYIHARLDHNSSLRKFCLWNYKKKRE